MTKRPGWKMVWVLVIVGAASSLASSRASAQDFDHMTCVNVSTDRRLAKAPPPLTLNAEQAEFLDSEGCKVVGAVQIARADELCYPTSKEPGGPPSGVDLSGQNFLCYRVKCELNELNMGGRTELSVSDQFGEGTVFVNERLTTKRLCVPAFLGTGPSPTPSPGGSPTPSPDGSPTPTPVATPTPTPGGSASLAFVDPVASLLQ